MLDGHNGKMDGKVNCHDALSSFYKENENTPITEVVDNERSTKVVNTSIAEVVDNESNIKVVDT